MGYHRFAFPWLITFAWHWLGMILIASRSPEMTSVGRGTLTLHEDDLVIYCAGASPDWYNAPAWQKRLMQVLGRLELKAVGRVKHEDGLLEGQTR